MFKNVCPGTKPLPSKGHLRLCASTAALRPLGAGSSSFEGGASRGGETSRDGVVSSVFSVWRSAAKRQLVT